MQKRASTSLSFIRLKDARRATAKWLCCSSIISSNFCCSCGHIGTLGTAKWLHIKHWMKCESQEKSLEEGWSHKCGEASRDAVNHEGADVFYHSQVHFEKSTRHFAARAYSNDNRSTTISWHWGTRRDWNCWMHPPVPQSATVHPLPSLMLGLGMAPMDQSEGECLMWPE